jgi:hypothetical protein
MKLTPPNLGIEFWVLIKNKMNLTDFKIYILNGSSLMISFTNIDAILKILLLSVTIGYTIHKWYLMNKKK